MFENNKSPDFPQEEEDASPILLPPIDPVAREKILYAQDRGSFQLKIIPRDNLSPETRRRCENSM
jgi:hypothetical protein